MSDNECDVVLVTGATGYVAGHVVLQLQLAGYKVRGTVRQLPDLDLIAQEASLTEQRSNKDLPDSEKDEVEGKWNKLLAEKKKMDKVEYLYNLCPDAKHKLELVYGDLTDADCWTKAVEGVKYVMHVASPFVFAAKKESDVIDPAVNGTKYVLQACVNTPSVKRVVVTSSYAAICPADGAGDFTEDKWSPTEGASAYYKSKAFAEKAAWDIAKSDDAKFELVVLNPSMVFGPPLNKTVGVSIEVMQKFLTKGLPLIPKLNFPMTDVRDVAECHVKAITVPEAAGNRHIIAAKSVYFYEIGEMLAEEFRPQGYTISTRRAPTVNYMSRYRTSLVVEHIDRKLSS